MQRHPTRYLIVPPYIKSVTTVQRLVVLLEIELERNGPRYLRAKGNSEKQKDRQLESGNRTEEKEATHMSTRGAKGATCDTIPSHETSLNAGRFTGQLDTIGVRPYGQLNAIIDNRTTSLCRDLNGTIRRLDDPWWETYYPTNHFRCRDTVTTLSDRELKRDGLAVTPDGVLTKIETPAKGFDHSPLEVFEPNLKKYSEDVRAQLKKALD